MRCISSNRTLCRECLDRLIVLNQFHLRRVLTEYSQYYNERRPHQGLAAATPLPLDLPTIDAPIRRRDTLGASFRITIKPGNDHFWAWT